MNRDTTAEAIHAEMSVESNTFGKGIPQYSQPTGRMFSAP